MQMNAVAEETLVREEMILVKMLSELPLLKTELSRATSDTDLYYARNNM